MSDPVEALPIKKLVIVVFGSITLTLTIGAVALTGLYNAWEVFVLPRQEAQARVIVKEEIDAFREREGELTDMRWKLLTNSIEIIRQDVESLKKALLKGSDE